MATLSSPTLQRLIQEVRIILNQPRQENSRWTDAELANYLNDGVQKYFAVINEVGEGQFDTQTDLNIVSGVETVTLPTDCYTVKVLYKKENSAYKPLIYRNNFTQAFNTAAIGGDSNSYEPSYYFRGNSIVLHPIPAFSETAGLRLEYTAFPEVMIYGGDTMTAGISPLFKELVVMYGVYKAKMKDDLVNGSDTSAKAAAHLSDLYNNFKHQVTERSKYPTFVLPFSPQ